jgi:hypothetical protein
MGMRVDQPGGDKSAAEVLDMIHVDDVVDDAGHALRKIRGGTRSDDAVVVNENGGIATDIGARPEPADVRQQPYRHSFTGQIRSNAQQRTVGTPCTS